MGRKRIPIEEKFWSKVDKSGECWLWTGSISNGYGRLTHEGKGYGAHKLSYILEHGAVPKGSDVCHNCPGGDNALCVRPTHLWLGTHLENMRDGFAKGQMKPPLGELAGRSKLTNNQVFEIRILSKSKISQRALGERFGVSMVAIHKILTGKTWKHLV